MTPGECPWCGEMSVVFEEVDIGVGMQQCGPAGCEDCHAVQIAFYGDGSDATPEEKACGFYQGDRVPHRSDACATGGDPCVANCCCPGPKDDEAAT